MTYILIFVFAMGSYNSSAPSQSALKVEFNELRYCKAAAAEIQKQATGRDSWGTPVIMCVPKGTYGK